LDKEGHDGKSLLQVLLQFTLFINQTEINYNVDYCCIISEFDFDNSHQNLQNKTLLERGLQIPLTFFDQAYYEKMVPTEGNSLSFMLPGALHAIEFVCPVNFLINVLQKSNEFVILVI
jgi:hypothetical protein